jgi:putative ABC transport system permease protein
MIDYISFTISGIKQNKLRFILSTLGIIVGIFLTSIIIILSGSFKNKMYNEMKVSDEKVLTIALGNKSNTLNYTLLPVFDKSEEKIVKENPHVIDVSSIRGLVAKKITIQTKIKGEKELISKSLYGANKNYFDNIGVDLREGRFFNSNNEAIIGATVAKVSNASIGDNVAVEYGDKVYNFKICGIFKEQKLQAYSEIPSMINNMIVISPNSDIFDNMKYIFISAKIDDVKNIDNVTKNLTFKLNHDKEFEKLISNTGYEAVVVSRKDVLNMIDEWFKYIYLFIAIISVFVALISIAGISNTMIMTIHERYQEIGIMKAIGASKMQISMFYIVESLIMGVIGTIVGLILGLIVSTVVVNIIGWEYVFDNIIFIICPVLGIGSSLLSGFIASRKAANLQPIDALNKE